MASGELPLSMRLGRTPTRILASFPTLRIITQERHGQPSFRNLPSNSVREDSRMSAKNNPQTKPNTRGGVTGRVQKPAAPRTPLTTWTLRTKLRIGPLTPPPSCALGEEAGRGAETPERGPEGPQMA
jgi:hypothetical protein